MRSRPLPTACGGARHLTCAPDSTDRKVPLRYKGPPKRRKAFWGKGAAPEQTCIFCKENAVSEGWRDADELSRVRLLNFSK